MLRKRFITNVFLLIGLNLLIKPLWIFGIDRSVQNIVGAEEYGLYFSLFSFSLLLNMILDFGITNYNNRNISRHNGLLTKSLSKIVGIRFILGAVYGVTAFAMALFLGYKDRELFLLVFLVGNQFVASFILYLRSNISALQLFSVDSIISVLDRFLMIIFCSLVIWKHVFHIDFTIEVFVYLQSAAYLITLAITFFIVLHHSGRFRIRFDWKNAYLILKSSLPFALLAFLMTIYYRVDSVMLERLLPDGKTQAGIYAQSFRILDAVSMYSFLIASLLLPMFSNMIKKEIQVNTLLKFSTLVMTIPVLSIVVASFFYGKEIIELLYYHHIENSFPVFRILILCFPGIALSYVFGTLLTANGNLKLLNLIALSGVVLNITLNLILIPVYKAYGSAIASLITQTLTAVLQLIFAVRLFSLRINLGRIIVFLAYVIAILLTAYFSRLIEMNWIYKFLAVLVVSLSLAFVVRLMRIRMLFEILFYED